MFDWGTMKAEYLKYFPLFWMLEIYPFYLQAESFFQGLTGEMVLFVLLGAGTMGTLLRAKIWKINLLDVSLVLFVLWYCCSTAFRHSVVDHWEAVRTVEYTLLYGYFRSISISRPFFLFLFVAGVIQALWGLLQCMGIVEVNHYAFAATGSFFNPALWGIFLTLAFLSGLSLYRSAGQKVARMLWVAGMVVLLVGIVFSGSRASWLALLAGGVWQLRTVSKERRGKLFCRNWLWFTLVLGGVFAFGLYAMRPVSVHGRFLIWQVIAGHIPDAFWCGHGALKASYMQMQGEWLQQHAESSWGMLAGNNVYAFNEFLRVLFESGMIGLLILLGLSWIALGNAWKCGKSAGTAGSLMVALAVFSLFGYPFESEWLVMIGVAVLAIISRHVPVKAWNGDRRGIVRWGVMLMMVATFIYAVPVYCVMKKADMLLEKAQYDAGILAESGLEKCYRELKGDARFVPAYGKLLYRQKRYAEALPVLERAACLMPSSQLLCDLGDCYRHGKLYRKAEEAYLSAARMVPAYIFPQYCLFNLYRETGNMDKALEKAGYMLEMPVKVVNTSVLRFRNQARVFIRENALSE